MKDLTNSPQDSIITESRTNVSNFSHTDMSRTDQTPNDEMCERMPEAKREFLLETIRRAPILESLQQEPVAASELSETVDMSRSTVHRSLKSLEEYDIVEESSDRYELTSLGRILAMELQTFGTRAFTGLSLKKFLNHVDINSNRIPLEHFADSKTTRRTSRRPHATIHRIIELIENADSLRMFSTVISPVHVDVGYREMMNGTEIEAIFDREAIDIMALEYPEKAQETVSTGNFDVYACERVPFELFLFEEKIGLAAHNENGNAEVLIESENPSAIEWAENLYAEYLSRAESVFDSDS